MSEETKPIDDGGPAFPFACQGATTGPEFYYGMTLRDYFAGQILPAVMKFHLEDDDLAKAWAEVSYKCADAMLAERRKKGGAS